MKKLIILLFLVITSVATRAQNPTNGGKQKPEQVIMDIRHYSISLHVFPSSKSIVGQTIVDVIMAKPTNLLLLDLMDSLHVAEVMVNNKDQRFEHKNNVITISLAKELGVGKASIKVFYGGKPLVARRPPWDDGFVWSTDSTGHPWIGMTQEGAGGKLYFPCKDGPWDEPNEGVDMNITVPSGLMVAGPGLLQSVTKDGGEVDYHWKTNYTINNYSIVFNVGVYKIFTRTYTTVAGHQVPIQVYLLKEHAGKGPHFLDMFEKTIHEQEKYFGEFPWAKEKIGMIEAPFEGMEQQTMIAYGNKFRYTKVGGEDYDDIMHHEFGHEWWGNKVTAKDWADYWIHEGINTFADALYIREFEGEAAYNTYFKRAAFGFENKLPIVQHPDMDEESAYIGDIYGKGAFFMHTVRYVMGDSLFFPAIKKFVTSPQYTYDNLVNTDDVEQFFSREAGRNLKPLFDLYLRTTDKLEVRIRQKSDDIYLVQLQNINIPLPLDIITDTGLKHATIGTKGILVNSKTVPVVDPNTFYLKKVIIE